MKACCAVREWVVVLALAAHGPVSPLPAQGDDACPPGFVRVRANPALGTSHDFCVSKYEMKIRGQDRGDRGYDPNLVAESRASGTPWIHLTLTQARAECRALGKGYDLISNPEWMTIAHDVESVAANWSDNATHRKGPAFAMLNVGHCCRQGPRGIDCRRSGGNAYSGGPLPAGTNDADGCYGYAESGAGAPVPTLNANGWNLNRRTHRLSNGAVIWDFSGNVWEWVDWYIPRAADRARIDGVIDNNFLEVNACDPVPGAMPALSFKSLNPDMTDVTLYSGTNYVHNDPYGFKITRNTNRNRLGRLHPTARDDGPGSGAGAAMRGGDCMHGDANCGIYAMAMGYGPNPAHILCEVGFRCVYRPYDAAEQRAATNTDDAREAPAANKTANP